MCGCIGAGLRKMTWKQGQNYDPIQMKGAEEKTR
uniref:Uncharacterized protein n=1 Tax=Arundo donax TaxID=35708 RepID=A0A0A9FEK8_ARUDO